MTRAVEIKIQEVSPESTFGGEETGVSANAAPTIKNPSINNRIEIFFITFLLSPLAFVFFRIGRK
jgi:hypothetical protein